MEEEMGVFLVHEDMKKGWFGRFWRFVFLCFNKRKGGGGRKENGERRMNI
jgi:hypothetical protein